MNKRIRMSFFSFALLLMMSLGSFGTVSAAEETPYFGKEYSQPEQVKKLYPEPDVDFDTPAFEKEGKAFTTQEEMLSFVKKLDESSDLLHVKMIGESIEGRELPALFFSKDDKKHHRFSKHHRYSKKPTVWLQGQIHGNEPAGGEGVLAMADKLSGEYGEKVLDKVNVIIVPRVNPDGAQAFERTTANGLDANRDHIKFELPEIQAIHDLYNKYNPEVTIDAHEYSVGNDTFSDLGEEGYLKYHDLLILSGKNLNIPEKIRKTSDELFVDQAQEQLRSDGFTTTDYYTTSRDDKKVVIKEGGTDPRIGRNAFGLSPSLSYLVETRGIGIGRENFKRRVAAQVETHTSLINTTAENARSIKRLVNKERWNIVKKGFTANDDDPIVIEDRQKEVDDQTLKVVDIANGKTKDIPIDYSSATDSIPTLTRQRPTAYFLEPDQKEAVEKLKNSGVKVFKLPKEVKLPAEAYTVTEKEEGRMYEGHQLINVKTEVNKKEKTFEKGTYVVTMAQPEANLAAVALEPESDDSYVTFNAIDAEEGKKLPIYRFTKGLNPRKLK
ncbi:M14 family metallopeptidase [Halobacillus salinarum]|uniref:M14 family metallopeptidase n=1 Tax=Halobacillus salinarum TaxID=2932257 RepID=A0ABY4EM70_9BACI|nr:M14 family metallopeptidase [Halobacillus salinarum]UOQ45546.1 M14 family metallopeptidase [Halobacillus salinarum]